MTPTDTARLEGIRARAEKATPGPWKADLDVFDHGKEAEIVACVTDGPVSLLAQIGTGHLSYQENEPREGGDARWKLAHASQAKVDATFIAESRSDVPWLVSQLEAAMGRERGKFFGGRLLRRGKGGRLGVTWPRGKMERRR